MVKNIFITNKYPKRRVNKSSKRDYLIEDVLVDIKLDRRNAQKKKIQKTSKPTTKSVKVTSSKLIGHYTTDIDGRNLVMDETGGCRVYSLPVEYQQIFAKNGHSSEDEVVDDWEQLTEKMFTNRISPQNEVFIPDCQYLNFNLLKGYIPMKDGGNQVGFAGRVRDRTGCMRWMVKNYQKLKSKDRRQVFDVDFNVGNGAIRTVMTSQNTSQLAVIRILRTYYIWDITPSGDETESNNKLSFGGLRFEDFVSRGMDGSENEPSSSDQNNYADSIKYYNVVRLTFAGYKMLVSGEVDCAIPGTYAALGKKPKAGDFIEVKTSAPLEDKSYIFRRYKTISWFAQCALMGVKHIVVGIRKEDGDEMTCKTTHAFTIEDIRKHSHGLWSKNRCFDALKKFLDTAKEKVTEDSTEVFNVFTLKNGVVSEPVKKVLSDDANLPDISEVVDLMTSIKNSIENIFYLSELPYYLT